MMRRVLTGAKWLVLAGVIATLGLLMPVGYNELACIPKPVENDYLAVLPPEHHRPESRTLLTYPEWHIVHAYDDYAKVISEGDPHDYGYVQAIRGFWSSLCELSYASARHGGFPAETKQMVYTIGVSFTAELLAKAAYEETLGRFAVWLRGDERSVLDDLSAQQAQAYARFLQQVPWYKWDFASDAAALAAQSTGGVRDIERRLALGAELRVKSAYAGVIEKAVAQVGADQLRLRMVVNGASPEELAQLAGVEVISSGKQGIEIETPRYRDLTHLMQDMAGQGVEFVEIAGNDDILFTALSAEPRAEGALFSFARQGYGDYRHLIVLRVAQLAARLREMQAGPLTLEHIHDY